MFSCKKADSGKKNLLDRGFNPAAMTIAIPIVTPACLKQASRMGDAFNSYRIDR